MSEDYNFIFQKDQTIPKPSTINYYPYIFSVPVIDPFDYIITDEDSKISNNKIK